MMADKSHIQAVERPARRIACYPLDRLNPYLPNVYAALAAHGYVCDLERESPGWRLRDKIGDADILHLHWGIEDFYRDPSLFKTVRLLARFVFDLVSLRLRGKKIVWTCHNLVPHERRRPWADWLAHFALAQLASCILMHAECIRGQVARSYLRRRRMHVVPNGPYAEAERPVLKRAEARRKLGLPEADYVYLFAGHIREYKGVPELLAAFCELNPSDATLLIAGRVSDPRLAALLQDASKDPRVRVVGSGEDDLFYAALDAADALVLPFRRITTSSSCYLGPNEGLPLILPSLPYPREVFGEDFPLFYKPGSVSGLARCMRDVRGMDGAALRKWYDAVNASLSWEASARAMARAFDVMYDGTPAPRTAAAPPETPRTDPAPGLQGLFVVSVVYNGLKWYRACIESILAAGIPPERIIIVENASPDGGGDCIARDFPGVSLLRMDRNVGAADGANRGLRVALDRGARHVLMLNIDVTISPDMPRKLLETMRAHPEYGILSPVQYNYSGEKLDENFARMHPPEEIAAARNGLLDAKTVIGAGVLVSRRVYETVGGFDTTYFVYGEEDDFCRRARYHGIKVGVVAAATMRHWHMAINTEPSPFIRKLRSRNQFIYKLKDPAYALPKHLYLYLRYYVGGRLAGAARRRDWRAAATVLGAQIEMLRMSPRILRNRRKEREGRCHL
jgi:GT2 family glycosyltransferase/glycosyltransferase involved in cell wall biosynthesis